MANLERLSQRYAVGSGAGSTAFILPLTVASDEVARVRKIVWLADLSLEWSAPSALQAMFCGLSHDLTQRARTWVQADFTSRDTTTRSLWGVAVPISSAHPATETGFTSGNLIEEIDYDPGYDIAASQVVALVAVGTSFTTGIKLDIFYERVKVGVTEHLRIEATRSIREPQGLIP